MDLRERLKHGILVGDGAMGTMLQRMELDAGHVPEVLNFTKAEQIRQIHVDYFSKGCDFVTTNTFGANRLKTGESGYTVEEIMKQGVALAKAAADLVSGDGKPRYVALGLGPIGKLMRPTGDLAFEDAVQLFKEQILPGVSAGADLLLIETISDLYEMKAAVIAAREVCDLPLFCSVTFQEDGRMLMGADPLTVVTVLQDLGIDAIGVNCSLGPVQMIPIVKEILQYSHIPVLVQPNAGLPRLSKGETVFDVDIPQFIEAMEEMMEAGVSVVGGCCGTTPEYIRSLVDRAKAINDKRAKSTQTGTTAALARDMADLPRYTAVASSRKTVLLDDRIRVIGERINPTGKSALKEALREGDLTYIENEAIAQVKAGAAILDINVGLPGIDEKEMMLEAVRRVSAVVDVPLQIDSADPEVLEAAVRSYNGRPIINSVNGKQSVMDAVFPIAQKYGACLIALTLDDAGLPETTEQRVAIAEKIIKEAESYGIGRERILVDCLTLTVSAQQRAGRDTLAAIREVKQRFGVKTTLGASNVSFGLPNRKLLNRTFLAMALEAGLDAPITDPLVEDYMDAIRAYETLAGKDVDSRDFIACYGGGAESSTKSGSVSADAKGFATEPGIKQAAVSQEQQLTDIILNGFQDRAAAVTANLLTSKEPLAIVEEIIIPALEVVGSDYESGVRFLPQLVQSADTVREAFEVLKAHMAKAGDTICYGRILMATVKGDIHDIGKNIVKVILENYGYEVLDLGRDTDIDHIVETAKAEKIRMIGLSALMTTTVMNMEKTIKAIRAADIDCKIAVGGAVLNAEYARQIGADFYCKDAMDGVRAANAVFKEGI
ncbi:MAG: homocysteine methyltransferase [Firmicutes bacterium HGW-Firmicutes-11]|jgi:5-methyltetrahydrofolate--homocysteine methyltransferase|nr:MAG: homocysteine methyltransferase [Firmicutes bacterium HGW-Firmicutes-11]